MDQTEERKGEDELGMMEDDFGDEERKGEDGLNGEKIKKKRGRKPKSFYI